MANTINENIGTLIVVNNTKKPTGLKVQRNGSNMNVSWKIGDKDYKGGTILSWRTNLMDAGKWNTIKLSSGTSKQIALNWANYIPARDRRLTSFRVKVKGLRKNYTKQAEPLSTEYQFKWSDEAEYTFTFEKPFSPKVSVSLDDELDNRSRFSWEFNKPTEGKRVCVDLEWQSVLLKNSDITDGAKAFDAKRVLYESGSSTYANSGIPIREDSSYINKSDAYTRWFRARTRGPAGRSSWVYKKHVYGRPYAAQNLECKALWRGNGYRIDVTWTSNRNSHRPIDKMVLQYLAAVPDTGMTPPAGATWTDALTVAPKDGTDGGRFVFDTELENDECLFVRVDTIHDREHTPSEAVVAIYGNLKDPTLTNVVTVDETHRATITAENESAYTDSFLAVLYKDDNNPGEVLTLGIIENGQTSVTVQCPDWGTANKTFGVRAMCGEPEAQTREDGVSVYSIYSIKNSNEVWENGQVPVAPDGVTATRTSTPGTVRVTWNNTWTDATATELSWADHEDAWESTDQPASYTVSNIYAAAWNIAGLEVGKTWYIRVRLLSGTGDDATPGPWSKIVPIKLSEAPNIPVLELSKSAIPADGTVTASWTYVSNDGTPQTTAEICEATITSTGIIYGDIIATVTTPQHVDLNAAEIGWEIDNTYNLCVRVGSESGEVSEWSDPNAIAIVPPLTCTITQSSLENVTVEVDSQTHATESVLSLTDMPFTCTVTGAGATGTTTVAIERAGTYYLDRPDERTFTGHDGETIALFSQMGEAQITIANDELIGTLDDGAPYRLVATVQDGFGQSAEASIDFEVHWSHQALMPEATVEIDNENYIAIITPIEPQGAEQGDTVDIYRLSVDRPELIYSGAEFGTAYVDPYPALGEMGGHRIVYKTANGDYITEDNELAWTDYTQEDTGGIDTMYNIIDYSNGRVNLMYDINLSSGWEKEFQQTKYLGGAIQGDWNPAVSRTGSVSGDVVTIKDQETIREMRRLADNAGICHVRTRDGSSYAADVQVSEARNMGQDVIRSEFTLSITRVDPEGYDGMTYADWEREESE